MHPRVIAKRDRQFDELILASTSAARRALMDGLGVPYRAVAPGVDEQVPEGTEVRDAVAMLAQRKAQAVAQRHGSSLVIGSDQLVSIDGVALGKPEDRAAARAQLKRLSGRKHEIVTGVCVIGPQISNVHVEVTTLRLYPLGDEEVEAYLDLGEWEGCAGGYRVEGRGQALFSEIEGDRTNVQGLPMVALVRMLRNVGYRFF